MGLPAPDAVVSFTITIYASRSTNISAITFELNHQKEICKLFRGNPRGFGLHEVVREHIVMLLD